MLKITFRGSVAAICMLSTFVSPSLSLGETPLAKMQKVSGLTKVRDVVLGAKSTLSGVVKSEAGSTGKSAVVTVAYAGNPVATVETLQDGRFAIEGLREGTHVVNASGRETVLRFWSKERAPAGAESEITLVGGEVSDPNVVAAGHHVPPTGPVRGFLGRAFANYPLLTTAAILGAGIGAGIAIGSNGSSTPVSP
ncbi:MAG: hypothetical protein ACKOCN_09455 [Planctomycetaceae bacterium]